MDSKASPYSRQFNVKVLFRFVPVFKSLHSRLPGSRPKTRQGLA
jgi:hypothetical protein